MATETEQLDFQVGTLHLIYPGLLLLERNIREATPSPELVESIRDNGVLQPITAVTTADGSLLVRSGHRRTLAALEADLDQIPVYVVGTDDQADEAEISRIVGQHAENTHRVGLTAGDDVAVFEQLAAFGLPADQIATRTRAKVDRVETALRVSRSELARKAAGKYEALTLDQAATVAEFEHDTDLAKSLIVAAVKDPGKFAHLAQEARDEQLRENRRQRLLEDLALDGAVVIDPPDYNGKPKAIDNLKGKGSKPLTLDAHKKCPGYVAWLYLSWEWVDQAGNPVQRVDQSAGHRDIQTWKPRYGCADPKKYGHEDLYSYGGGSSTTTKAADLPEAEREKASKARKLVIDNNKAWDAATVVRREFLADLAKGKTPPKGAAAFIVATLAHDRSIIGGETSAASELCSGWGLTMAKGSHYGERPTVPEKATDARALLTALVVILADHEAATDRMAWRRNGKDSREGRYLRFLQSCGYGLSDVEKFALNTKTA